MAGVIRSTCAQYGVLRQEQTWQPSPRRGDTSPHLSIVLSAVAPARKSVYNAVYRTKPYPTTQYAILPTLAASHLLPSSLCILYVPMTACLRVVITARSPRCSCAWHDPAVRRRGALTFRRFVAKQRQLPPFLRVNGAGYYLMAAADIM